MPSPSGFGVSRELVGASKPCEAFIASLAAHRSSPRDNHLLWFSSPGGYYSFRDFLLTCGCPRGIAAAVEAKNMPQAYFLNAPTVLQEIIILYGFSVPEVVSTFGTFFIQNHVERHRINHNLLSNRRFFQSCKNKICHLKFRPTKYLEFFLLSDSISFPQVLLHQSHISIDL